MPIKRVFAPRIDFSVLRRELKLPDAFPADALAEAEAAAATQPAAPQLNAPQPNAAQQAVTATAGQAATGATGQAATGATGQAATAATGQAATGATGQVATDAAVRSGRVDLTDVPFVTIDPPTSRDLDQAMCLERRGSGYRVRYAIADVASFVRPGGALEAETWVRGQTVYLPDGKVPLHPPVLSEGAVSLLPDVVRAAVVWTIDLDADGAIETVSLRRALVRSRAKLDYAGVQAEVDAGTAGAPYALLPELGRLLAERAAERGAVNLPLPEQEIEPDGDGWRLVLRAPLAVEEHNAQISLLTGMAAAGLMLTGGIGLLRTMPGPRPEAVERLRAAAHSLGVVWPEGASVGAIVSKVDPGEPRGAAFLDQAAELLRGAGYTAFDGSVPELRGHGGVGAPYAHVTAPLRRLADRYATEACLALHDGREVPAWVRDALPRLPKAMAETDRVASAAGRGAIALAEAVLLAGRVGETFEAGVVDVDDRPRNGPGGTVALDDPAVVARCAGELPLGERIRVRLAAADPETRKVEFERA